MTSRERISQAFDHREGDRIPVDLNGHRSSGIMVQAYIKLRKAMGLPERTPYVYDFIQQLALVEDDVLEVFGADVVELGHDYYKKDDYWKYWEMPDGTLVKIPAFIDVKKTREGNVVFGDYGQVICIQKPGCHFYEQTCFPLAETEDEVFLNLPKDLQQIMWCRLGIPPAPFGLDAAGQDMLRKTAQNLRESTDKAIYATFGGNLVEIGEFAFRIDNFLCELAANPRRIHAFLDKLTEMHLANLEKYLDAVGDYIDIIGFGDDMGMQTGPQFSRTMYREFFKPHHTELWKAVKKIKPKVRVSLHCCGGVYPLLPDMIEAGLEAINPVQFTCKDMELARLKKEFGKDLVLWGGGCDTREVLYKYSPEEVKRHVRENINILRKDGGFVFQQVHNIMADVPPENLIAMYEEVQAG